MNLLRRITALNHQTCPWWFAYTFDNPLRRRVHNARAILGELVAEGHTVVDLGCGLGYFALEMAEIVGSEGRVIAVDLQSEMLDTAKRRAIRRGLQTRIDFRQCKLDSIGVSESVDFVLAFWMLHEVRGREMFLSQIRSILKPSGYLLIVEPRGHVSNRFFASEIEDAKSAGFIIRSGPAVRFSRAALCVPNTTITSRATGMMGNRIFRDDG